MADLSDLLGPSLQLGSTILGVGSNLSRASAVRTVGKRRQAADEFEAQQLEAEAAGSRGVGLRAAADEVLKTETINSTALARAAASGAGASDKTVMDVIARTAGEGAYRSALAMYEGEAQARLDMQKAAALRYEGSLSDSDAEAAARMARMSAGSTLLSGAARGLSMYDKYWSGPTPTKAVGTNVASASGISAGNRGWQDAGTQQLEDMA